MEYAEERLLHAHVFKIVGQINIMILAPIVNNINFLNNNLILACKLCSVMADCEACTAVNVCTSCESSKYLKSDKTG